jgi:hypothetical protein
MNDSFTDKVKTIKVTNDGIKIGFELHAAFYKLNKTHPDFKKLQMELEQLQKSHQNVKVTAAIPEMEIKEIALEK